MRPPVLVALLLATATSGLFALDLSGTYEAAGTILQAEDGPAGGKVSLHALFALEFDHGRAATIHSLTTKVIFEQADGAFRVKCLDADDEVMWKGEWRRLAGYDFDADKVKLLLRAERFGHDGFLFLLSNDGKKDLLVVEIRRIVTTWYGPVFKPVGTFYFLRALE